MTFHALAIADSPVPKKRGPNTPEGKARSRLNALKHGLRARTFGILPEEDQDEWTLHLQDLRQGYGPIDAAEEKLVTAIAASKWHEIRADRTLAEVLAAIPPLAPGRPHGGDLQEPRHALSLTTALRYLTAAGMASQRAQRAFLAHRKAKQAGLTLPAEVPVKVPANQDDTNEFRDRAVAAPPAPAVPGDAATDCTNELPATDPAPAGAGGAANEECTNGFPHLGATGRVPEPSNRHQRRRLEALARRARAA